MKKGVLKILAAILALIVVSVAVILIIKFALPDDTPTEVYIVKDGETEYAIIYSSSTALGGRYAYSFNQAVATVTGITLESGADDSSANGIKEILLGDTNRQLSKDLKADIESKTASDSHVWGFAYRDGQLAFYFNSQVAFEKGLEEFKTAFLKDGCLVVSSDTWKTSELTLSAYNEWLAEEEARLKAEAAAKKLEELTKRLEVITAEIASATYKDEDFGATEGWLADYAMPTDRYEPGMSITEEHPRVLLTKDTIPKIKALLEDPEYKNMADAFWKMADSKGFTGVFPERTHTTQAAMKDGTKPTGYETYRFDGVILAEIEARALAYLITGHKAYAYEAIHGIKNAMLTYKFTQENHMDVYHGPSQIMVILSEVYDWCYDVLTENDKKQLISGCVYLLIEAKQFTDDDFVLDMNKPSLKATLSNNQADYGLEFNFPPDNMNAINGHGTGPQFLRDYMMVTVAFADEMPSWWDYVGGRFCQEYLPAAVEMYKNGYVTQGTAIYGTLKIYNNLVPAQLLKTATGKNPYPDYVAECADFLLSHTMPNGKLFETGDGQRTTVGADFAREDGYVSFYFFAALYNDTFSLEVAKQYSANFTKYATDSVVFSTGPATVLALLSECDKASGKFPEDMPLYNYTKTPGGQTITRSSWNSDAAAVFMKIGEVTMGNHDHAESGTFQIYYKGFLAVTSGFYGKYGSVHHENYHQMTVSKNGLLVYNPTFKGTADGWYSGSQRYAPSYDTLEQWQSGMYDMGEVTGILNKAGEYSYLAGDITKAYDEETVDYVGRRMLTVFTNDAKAPMLFFVFDSITSDDESFKKSFLLHTVKEPTIAGAATDKSFTVTPDANGKMTATVINGEGALVLQNVYGGNYMHKIGGEGFACWIGNENEFDGTAASGVNCPQGSYGDMYEKIWGRIEVTTRGEKKSDMLNVIYVTDSGDIKNMPATLVEDTENNFVGATVGNTTAMFARSESRASGALTFTTSGEGTMRYFISGLYEGTWKVSVNGGSAVEYTATTDSGMIEFEGAPGTVTITPGTDVVPEGYSRISYSLSGGALPEDAPYMYKEGEVTVLPTPTKENAVFLGWYSDKNYTDKITEIPATATKTFKVYAKFFTYDVYVDYDYSRPSETALSLQNDTQSSTKIKAVATLSYDTEKGALVWNVEKGVSKLYKRSTPLISNIDSEDHALTYTVTLSRKVGSPVSDIGFKLAVSSATGKNYGNCNIFTTRNDGKIYLAGDTSKQVAILPEDGTPITITFVVDFDGPNNDSAKATFTAYDESGEKLQEKLMAVTNTDAVRDGVDTMYKWSKWLSTFQVWMDCGQSYDESNPTAICFHKIYAIESDIITNPIDGGNEPTPEGYARIEYNLSGGELRSGAPATYKVGESLTLPIPTSEGGIFLGWYTDSEFTNKVTEIPSTATGTFKVYAKFHACDVYVDYDYSIPDEDTLTLQNDTQSSTKIKAVATLTVDAEKGALVWNVEKGVSKLYKSSVSPLISNVDSADHAVTYTVTLSRKVGVAVSDIGFKFAVSGSATGKNYGNRNLFTTRNNGNVYLDGDTSKLITTLPEDGTPVTVTVVVDFDGPNNDSAKATFTAYGESGERIVEKEVPLTNTTAINDGVDTMYEWSKWLSTFQVWMDCGQAYDVSNPTAICFHRILGVEGDTITNPIDYGTDPIPEGHAAIEYELYGGKLASDAPTTYKVGESLTLPIPTRDGGIFLGWYTDSEFTNMVTEIPATATGTFKVYAKFQVGGVICEAELNEDELTRVNGNNYKFNEEPKSDSNLFISVEIADSVSTNGGANIYKDGQKGFIYSEWDLEDGAAKPSSDNNNHYKINLNESKENFGETGIVFANTITLLCDDFSFGNFQYHVHDYYVGSSGLKLEPIKILQGGKIEINKVVFDGFTLEKGVAATIAIHIRIVKPTAPDAEGDLTTLTGEAFTAKYGKVVFDTYINGVMVAEGTPLLTEEQQKTISTESKDTDCTAVTGLATDFKISYIRFTSGGGNYEGEKDSYDGNPILRLDAVKVYSSNTYLEKAE